MFTEAQAGFRKGYSTTDHIFTLHAIIEKQFSRNAKRYVAFVDFYKAFDTVSHTMMWLVLSRTGIQGKMLTMLRGRYASTKACVRCSGSELSDCFECLQGLKQGCLCNPVWFTYFINELPNDIIRGGIHGIQLMPNRYSVLEANRACPFYPDKAEDEAHVLFDCFVYGNVRNVYINKVQNISLQEQVLSVLKCTDESSFVVS